MPEIVSSPFVRALGLALVHFVWQGAAIGLLAAVALAALRRRSPTARYAAGCLALAAMAVAPVVTTAALLTSAWAPAMAPGATTLVPVGVTAELSVLGRSVADAGSWNLVGWAAIIDGWLPSIVLCWAGGVLLLAGRLGLAWRNIARIRRHRLAAVTAPLDAALERVRAAMGFSASVDVAESTMVDGPTVVGWWRPLLLMPVSVVAGLSPTQLDAILAHELAHIRRRDHLVNGLQTVLETTLFYQPAVWWVSAQVRREREHCCDDAAVDVVGDRLTYVTALASIEEWRQAPTTALAATGGHLLSRVQRILGVPMTRHDDLIARGSLGAIAAVLTFAVVALLVSPRANAQSAGDEFELVTIPLELEVALEQERTAALQKVARDSEVLLRQHREQEIAIAPRPVARATRPAAPVQLDTQVATVDAQFRSATVNRSGTTLNALLADEFIATDQAGLVDNKTSFVGRLGTLGVTSVATQSRSVQMSGDLAVVTGVETEARGTESMRVLFTRVWRRTGTTWRLVSSTQFRDPRVGSAPGRASAPTAGQPGEIRPARPPVVMAESVYPASSPRVTGTITMVPPPPLQPGATVRVGGDVKEPKKVMTVVPIYPAVAKEAGVTGVVILEAVINENGDVANLQVLRGHPMLNQAALDAVQQWKYEPVTLNGVPVSLVMTVTVNFQLAQK
jgi:TonB family protein